MDNTTSGNDVSNVLKRKNENRESETGDGDAAKEPPAKRVSNQVNWRSKLPDALRPFLNYLFIYLFGAN